MSQRNRLNLRDLAGLRKPLIQTEAAPVEQTPTVARQEEENTVTPDVPPVPPTVPTAVPREVPPRILEQRRERRRLVAQSFKLPAELDERWSKIATYNKITKTGILLEALETLLDRLPQPPTGES
jgi:hypothetical protein